jgi:NADPH-dependent ferric siderophore reductase
MHAEWRDQSERTIGFMTSLEQPTVDGQPLPVDIASIIDAVPSRPAGDLEDDQLLAKSRDSACWDLTVTGVEWIAPRMLQLAVSAPALEALDYRPGHDFTVLVASAGGRAIRRRYTIAGRSHDVVRLEVYVHGTGIGTTWARARRPGDSIRAIGPRGSFVLRSPADWHVFIGDETSIPGINAMLAAADCPAEVIVEVDDPREWQPLAVRSGHATQWTWLPRGSSRHDVLVLATVGSGHAYVSGEAGLVSAWRAKLERLGMDPSSVTHKAYWGAGRANATHGEPLV